MATPPLYPIGKGGPVRNAVCALALVLGVACAADWQPAKGPLATRWAKDVAPAKAHPEYPRPQMARKQWQSLNGLWDYAIRPKDGAAPKQFDGQILVPFPLESALSGVMKRIDEKSRLWYRRTVQLPGEWRGKRVLLHFGAVDWEATVAVNGKDIGSHRGGYDAFSFDITDALKPAGPQEIVLGVFDPSSAGNQPRGKQVSKPRGIWYTPTTGIWQTAWLEPVPEQSIRELVLVPDVDAGALRLTVLGRNTDAKCWVRALATVDGTQVGESAEGPVGKEIVLKIPAPKLWSPDTPFLYGLSVYLQRAKGTDVLWESVEGYFGLRKASLGKDERGNAVMMLNNKPIFHIGPLDQGFWPDGLYTAPTDEALRYDVEMTRKLGFNCARKHVKIEPARWYYWCDRLGLMVWQDMPNGNNKTPEARKQFEAELTALVKGRRNHPSIVMWVPFNEGWGQHDTERYAALVKKLDPTRLVNNASGWTDKKVGDVFDIHSYRRLKPVNPEAKRAIVIGEFGGLGLGVDGHTWAQRHWGYTGAGGSAQLTAMYVKLLRELWNRHRSIGLSGAIYTQTTDVETECNGLMTYDRAVVKFLPDDMAKGNRGKFPPPPILKTIVPTAEKKGFAWRYTTGKPADGWTKPDFDDSKWKEGPAGFGRKDTPGAVSRTEWTSSDIWIRRSVDLPQGALADPHFRLHHDEDAEVYINGVLAAKATGFSTAYEELAVNEKGRAAIKPGKNVLAAHCRQTKGGQYIDLGIIDIVPRPAPKK